MPDHCKILTLQDDQRKSNGKVQSFSPLDAAGLALRIGCPTLRDSDPEREPSEKLLQQIWEHQRLLRDQLLTLDGEPVQVLHPGFWNGEPGPDFRGAILQIGNAAAEFRTGDVELDLSTTGWRQHRHDENQNYTGVILRVVWDAARGGQGALPILPLRHVLDASLSELAAFFETKRPPSGFVQGQCASPLRNLSEPDRAEMLRQAARDRFQRKAAELEAWARQAGWEQALWLGLFGALGYKHNIWPMRRVAELIPRLFEKNQSEPISVFQVQARLLGISQLLPNQLPGGRRAIDQYIRNAWDIWWRERDQFLEWIIPMNLWRFAGVRPANHPHRRLGLAAHWLAHGRLPASLQQWLCQDLPVPNLAESLLKLLQVEDDPFWSFHWTLRSRRFSKAQPLLGPQRLTDLAVNVILPWLWIRAAIGGNTELQARAETRYFAWPGAEDNAVLRLARERLFGNQPVRLRGAAAQQGLLQIVREFCDRSNALCQQCLFPELLRLL